MRSKKATLFRKNVQVTESSVNSSRVPTAIQLDCSKQSVPDPFAVLRSMHPRLNLRMRGKL